MWGLRFKAAYIFILLVEQCDCGRRVEALTSHTFYEAAVPARAEGTRGEIKIIGNGSGTMLRLCNLWSLFLKGIVDKPIGLELEPEKIPVPVHEVSGNCQWSSRNRKWTTFTSEFRKRETLVFIPLDHSHPEYVFDAPLPLLFELFLNLRGSAEYVYRQLCIAIVLEFFRIFFSVRHVVNVNRDCTVPIVVVYTEFTYSEGFGRLESASTRFDERG
ncbi:hypothetical protein F5879DRAFT_920257 [Lentinula edodes]|nr:hypothetical protein F5879DRAFT_920257 [Lentinula edodes]